MLDNKYAFKQNAHIRIKQADISYNVENKLNQTFFKSFQGIEKIYTQIDLHPLL